MPNDHHQAHVQSIQAIRNPLLKCHTENKINPISLLLIDRLRTSSTASMPMPRCRNGTQRTPIRLYFFFAQPKRFFRQIYFTFYKIISTVASATFRLANKSWREADCKIYSPIPKPTDFGWKNVESVFAEIGQRRNKTTTPH